MDQSSSESFISNTCYSLECKKIMGILSLFADSVRETFTGGWSEEELISAINRTFLDHRKNNPALLGELSVCLSRSLFILELASRFGLLVFYTIHFLLVPALVFVYVCVICIYSQILLQVMLCCQLIVSLCVCTNHIPEDQGIIKKLNQSEFNHVSSCLSSACCS